MLESLLLPCTFDIGVERLATGNQALLDLCLLFLRHGGVSPHPTKPLGHHTRGKRTCRTEEGVHVVADERLQRRRCPVLACLQVPDTHLVDCAGSQLWHSLA